MRRFRLLGHGLAEAAGHRVEPLADRLREFRLPRAEHFRDGAHAALHFGLALQDAGHPRLGVAGMVGGFCGSEGPRPGRTPQGDDKRQKQAKKQDCAECQCLAERDRGGAEPGDRFGQHGCQVIHADTIR